MHYNHVKISTITCPGVGIHPITDDRLDGCTLVDIQSVVRGRTDNSNIGFYTPFARFFGYGLALPVQKGSPLKEVST